MARKFNPEMEYDDGWTDWVHPLPNYRFSCCDCGLVHNLQFRIDDLGQINFRASRNQRSTGQVRRGMIKRGEGLIQPAKLRESKDV
jgi:hypothetical protein